MLNSLRSAAGTWVAKLLLILLVLSFAIWGISGQIAGGVGTHVVSAGDTNVSAQDYRLAYDRQILQLSQQFGTRITREQARAFGIDQQVLSQLVAGALLDEQAREMKLGLSRDRLAALTAEDPAFHGPDGRFDRNQFDFVLRQAGMRPEDYLNNREQVAVRQQIVEAVSDGLQAPDAFLRAVSLYRGEDRTVEYLTLPKTLVEPIEEPTEDVLKAYFEENKSAYAAPEYRKISYVKLEPEDIADPASISEEQAKEYYDANAERYTTAERRRIEQVVFASEDAARAALEKIRSGTNFEDIVAAEGKTMNDVLLGTFEKSRVADRAIADAAFSVAQGEVSDVVPGAFGSILLRVTEITPAVARPFGEVSQEIKDGLALDEAHRILLEVHDAYEDSRAGGETMAEAAAKQRLKVVTVEAVDRSGRDPQGTILTDLPQSNELLAEAFETETGIENPPLTIGSQGYVFYEVDGIDAARDRTFEEVRDRVETDWTAKEATTRLAAKASETEKAIRDGKPMADVAQELGLEIQTKRGLKRMADDADLGESGVAAAFGVAKDATGVVSAPNEGGQIVFKVTEVFEPVGAGAEAVPENQRNSFATGLANDLLDQLVARLQGQYPVTVNQPAIDQALSF
ncbi:SurA N-terminal domain-containing protein [Aquamicrobium sp. LC103]|uniref:SurA N-terminal domain-containing protein n=1 Tax=Aquamicrobium sp. LC103 TaxID=1120658 RepID=UPI00063E89A1|nr:SurA N-terminal domain-containing protein [Aquamicrobium sp. LC103]TKT79382.1 peptidylprolyl isomerase [Aquamicrobium sp. LC103]